MTPSANRPSKKQHELLSYIDGFVRGHGYGPSYPEMMRALDYKSVSTVAVHVDNLIKIGRLKKTDHSARSLVVVDSQNQSPAQPETTPDQAKWLVDEVSARFADYEAEPTDEKYDQLCVLVGALSILGLEDAATSFKPRLNKPD